MGDVSGMGSGIGARSALHLVPSASKRASVGRVLPDLSGASLVKRPEVIDINQRVRDLAGTINVLCGRNARVDLDLAPCRLLSRVDAAAFDSALLDLVAAARSALPIPAPALGQRDAAGRPLLGQIKIRTRSMANRVWLMVADTGVKRRFAGLDAKPEIGPGVAARAVDLHRVRALVARNRGLLRARSCRNRGAAVLVILPTVLGVAADGHDPYPQQPHLEHEEQLE